MVRPVVPLQPVIVTGSSSGTTTTTTFNTDELVAGLAEIRSVLAIMAGADTIEDLQAQVAALQQKVNTYKQLLLQIDNLIDEDTISTTP